MFPYIIPSFSPEKSEFNELISQFFVLIRASLDFFYLKFLFEIPLWRLGCRGILGVILTLTINHLKKQSKNISKNIWLIEKLVVLLHPLSIRERRS